MKIFIILLFFGLFSPISFAMKLTEVGKGFDIIWGMEFISDTKIILTERSGRLLVYDIKTKKKINVKGVPDLIVKGQGGLLDITLHPNFSENKKVYLSYSKDLGETYVTAIGFGVFKDNKLNNFKDIFIGKGISKTRYHFGSRIVFDGNGHIFFSIGDRGQRPMAQKLDNHFGKIMRIKEDGTVPKDNPFIGRKGALPEIWSYGHRNPQGLFYDKVTNTLYDNEHGPRGGDEINIIKKGQNYGWARVSHGKEYSSFSMVGEAKSLPGMIDPIKVYIPSIAPSDLIYYTSDFHPQFKGSLLSGALALTHLNQFVIKNKSEKKHFEDESLRMRALSLNKAGQLFIGADNGKLYRVDN